MAVAAREGEEEGQRWPWQPAKVRREAREGNR
jgi:hypothetical protein